jgi:hypothetical protein
LAAIAIATSEAPPDTITGLPGTLSRALGSGDWIRGVFML